jgi:hypothetical protein
VSFTMKVQEEKVLPEDTYPAYLDRIEMKTITFQGETSERLMWVFRLPEENDLEIVGFSSMSPSTKAKAYQWATAVNPQIKEEKNWGPEDVEGTPCRVLVSVKEDAQGVEKNRVERVLPAKAGKSKADPEPPDFGGLTDDAVA